MATTRELKGRINSIHSSQKITGAMKMIASARLRKAENALYNTRPYLEEVQRLLDRITQQDCEYASPLGEVRKLQRVGLIVFGSDDGLCGSFNLLLYKKFLETLTEYQTGLEEPVMVYPIGRKIRTEVRKTPGVTIMDIPEQFSQREYNKGILMMADQLIDFFLSGKIDRIEVIYVHFKSIGTQEVKRMQLLPWKGEVPKELSEDELNKIYIYEPDCATILELLYPLAIRSNLLQTLLENQASEQAARILSMQMANDNAIKLLKDLQLEYNKLRQQVITAELLDIAGGSVE